MSIDINKIININTEYGGVSVQNYFQISPRRGIKTAGNDWQIFSLGRQTIADLRNSPEWRTACIEYEMGLKAHEAGLAPKPIALNSYIALNNRYMPCITFEHIDAVQLSATRRVLGKYYRDNIQMALHVRLQQAGIYHKDLHDGNILVRLDDNGNVKRVWAIDFETGEDYSFAANLNIVEYKKAACSSFFGATGRPDYVNRENWIAKGKELCDDLSWYGKNFRKVLASN